MRRTKELGPQLARRVKLALEVSGLTITDAATLAHVSRQTLHTVLAGGGGNVGIGTICDLAKALNVRPCWLAFGEGDGPPARGR